MLSYGSHRRVFIATAATDCRKSYDGLSALVEGTFQRDLRRGDLFVFLNRRATQVRILYWGGHGYCIWMQRLEAGTFRRVPNAEGVDIIEVDAGELAMLLEGIDVAVIKRRKRYRSEEVSHKLDNA